MERINTDDQFKALLKKWKRKGDGGPGLHAPQQSPEPPKEHDARKVRLGWYIPPRHGPRDDRPEGDTLENFICHTKSQEVALQATKDWIRSIRAGEGGALALIGSVGSGKSHLLYAACRALNLMNIHCAAAGWYDLADTFREAKFGHDEDVTEARRRKWRIMGAAALCIDEIRPTSGTGFDTTELSQLMTRAYREQQGILVTSNFADDELVRIIGLAASSRLTQIKVTGPDMRDPKYRHLQAAS